MMDPARRVGVGHSDVGFFGEPSHTLAGNGVRGRAPIMKSILSAVLTANSCREQESVGVSTADRIH
jgi:hypothetical protein